jgi:hypothetical protein
MPCMACVGSLPLTFAATFVAMTAHFHQGVRGRNSDNAMIRAELGWEPTISIQEGMSKTIAWIKAQMDKEGGDATQYSESKVVVQTTDSLDKLFN